MKNNFNRRLGEIDVILELEKGDRRFLLVKKKPLTVFNYFILFGEKNKEEEMSYTKVFPNELAKNEFNDSLSEAVSFFNELVLASNFIDFKK